MTRNGRSRPAAQRTDAQRARSTSSGAGPSELTFESGRIRSIFEGQIGRIELDDPAADAPSVQRHAHLRADSDAVGELVRDEVVELLVQPGDVGNDPGDHRVSAIRRRRRT